MPFCVGDVTKAWNHRFRQAQEKKSKRIVTNSVHDAHYSMTKGMLDEDKVIETCDHDNIKCFQTCSEWEWFTSKAWRERGNYLDESCLK